MIVFRQVEHNRRLGCVPDCVPDCVPCFCHLTCENAPLNLRGAQSREEPQINGGKPSFPPATPFLAATHSLREHVPSERHGCCPSTRPGPWFSPSPATDRYARENDAQSTERKISMSTTTDAAAGGLLLSHAREAIRLSRAYYALIEKRRCELEAEGYRLVGGGARAPTRPASRSGRSPTTAPGRPSLPAPDTAATRRRRPGWMPRTRRPAVAASATTTTCPTVPPRRCSPSRHHPGASRRRWRTPSLNGPKTPKATRTPCASSGSGAMSHRIRRSRFQRQERRLRPRPRRRGVPVLPGQAAHHQPGHDRQARRALARRPADRHLPRRGTPPGHPGHLRAMRPGRGRHPREQRPV